MARLLFTVEDTFVIRGRGLVMAPGIVPEGEGRFHVGDRITLRRPDGSYFDTQIGGLELLDPNPRHDVVIMLILRRPSAGRSPELARTAAEPRPVSSPGNGGRLGSPRHHEWNPRQETGAEPGHC